MFVRPARRDDVSALFRLAVELALDGVPNRAAHAKHADLALASDDSLVLIAESDTTVTGYLVAGLLPMPLYGAALALLQELYVVESARGTGVGRALVEAFHLWACQRGAGVEALATSRRPAAGFYERLGFTTRPTAYYRRRVHTQVTP